MGESARVRLIRASQSNELRETFRQLAEIEGPEGPRFPRRILMDLAARIVGRAYEPMLLELCHLARAALLAGGRPCGPRGSGRHTTGAGFEWLFWGVAEARAGAFRVAFSRSAGLESSPTPPSRTGCGRPAPIGAGDALIVGDDAVILVYPEGRFEVRYGRMVGLAATMELLASTLGYRDLVAALDPLAAPVLDRGTVSKAARDLARRLYRWLADHLPAAQAQRKFRVMTAFLEEALGPDFTEEDIDDQTVLRFWLRRAVAPVGSTGDPDGGGGANADFRGYRTTFLAFLALVRVLTAGAALGRFERRVPIGPAPGSGEIDPAADWPRAEGAPEENPLARLQEEPAAAVKVLNRRELALLALPVGDSDGVRRLPRSYLRAECFGPVQNRLTQALRRKARAAELAALAAAGPDPGYRTRIEALEKVGAHLRRAALACLYVLHRIGAERDERVSGREGAGGGVTRLDFGLLGEARKAFEGLNRAGFERSAPGDPRLAPAYAALAERLPALAERLAEVLRTLGPPARWAAAETEDGPIFANAFARLYGAERGEDGRPAPSSGARGTKRASRGPESPDTTPDESPASTGALS